MAEEKGNLLQVPGNDVKTPKNRNLWWIVLTILFVVFICCCCIALAILIGLPVSRSDSFSSVGPLFKPYLSLVWA